MAILSVVAEFERSLLSKRTQAGLARARSAGAVIGRPSALNSVPQAEVMRSLAAGVPVFSPGRGYQTARQSIMMGKTKRHGVSSCG